jgi:hypothetical protein
MLRPIMTVPTNTERELVKAVEEVRAHEHGALLAEVASKALLDRAERAVARPDAEPGLAAKLGDEAGLKPEDRKTGQGDPFELLERGPKSAEEAAALGALLAEGVAQRLADAKDEAARRDVAGALLDRLDWLDATTALAPYQALGSALKAPADEAFWDAVARSLAEASKQKAPDDPTAAARRRTRLLVRASGLAHAPARIKARLATSVLAEVAGAELRRVALAAIAGVEDAESEAQEAGDPKAAAVRAASAARAPKLEGELEGKRWSGGARLLAAITGVLAIRWLLRLAGRYLLGLRARATVSLSATTVTIEQKRHLLGRVVREGTAHHALRSLRTGAVEKRARSLHLLIGALGLVLGAAVGVNFVVEGTCASYPALVLVGVALIGGGIVLDLLLDVLVPGQRGSATVALDFGPGKLVRLRGVDRAVAEGFVKELQSLIPPARK